MTNRRTTKAARPARPARPTRNGKAPEASPNASKAIPQDKSQSVEAQRETLTANANEDQQPVTAPAILIVKTPGESPNDFTIQIAELNGMDPFAVPNVLKLAVKIKNKQLGIDKED